MKPHHNAELFETPISTHWVDENGILCSLAKKKERKIEYYQEIVELYKKLTKNGSKLRTLSDSSNSMYMNKEVINYISIEYPKYIKAMAIVSTLPLGNTQVSTFLKLAFSNFPVMKFSNEIEAREWLMEQF